MPKTMLVVDDQSDVRDYVRMALDVERHRTYEASNGEDALLMAQSLRPDCVFLDIRMPGHIDGLDVCSRIKADAALRDTYVVIITAYGEREVVEAVERAGADACLIKPFTLDMLLTAADRAARRRARPALS